ncbi:HEAT repeat domain-containing protein [Phenylobacterium sp.]|jgi:HEAT repeat protein|uniref:HEAT repeat domain-containing protein n=1 Tax=Phenylobacterium sp. TaxID=1871053 RepID=UPI002F93826F
MPLIRKPADAQSPPSAPAADLRSTSADARWHAARASATVGDVHALAEALAVEADPRVREAILTSLARISTPAAAHAVVPYVRSDDAGLRTAALDALRAMPAAVATSLPALLDDPDADVRLLACEVVRELPGPEASQLLAELLEREAEANVCGAAIEVLAEVGGPGVLPALARCEARFADQPFLVFSARVAAERIAARPGDLLG